MLRWVKNVENQVWCKQFWNMIQKVEDQTHYSRNKSRLFVWEQYNRAKNLVFHPVWNFNLLVQGFNIFCHVEKALFIHFCDFCHRTWFTMNKIAWLTIWKPSQSSWLFLGMQWTPYLISVSDYDSPKSNNASISQKKATITLLIF